MGSILIQHLPGDHLLRHDSNLTQGVLMRPRYPSWLRTSLIILVPGLLILLSYVNYRFVLESPGGNEFLASWTAANSWVEGGKSPYDPSVRREVQIALYGRPAKPESGEFLGYFTPPLPAIVVYAPFTVLSFDIARAIWMTTLEVGLLALTFIGIQLVKWSPSRLLLLGSFVFALVWYHGVRAIILGPISILGAVLISGALLAIQRENDWIAGLLLGLAFIQPQLSVIIVLLVFLWAISTQRWQLLWSTVVFHVLILGLSVIAQPSWPFEWIQQTLELLNEGMTTSVSRILVGSFPSTAAWLRIGFPAALFVFIIWEWIQVWGKDVGWFIWTAALTISVSILFEPHISTEDYVLLLPLLVMIFGYWVERWGISGQIAVWISMLVLGVGLWLIFITATPGPGEPASLYLPLPLFTILGLLWVRWWVTRSNHRLSLRH